MHRKYGKDGLVVFSVHLDKPESTPAERKKAEEAALRFLKKVEAPYATLVLDEPFEFWQKKLGLGSVPIVYLFDRNNRTVAKYTDSDEAVAGLDKLVPGLLKKK
jgi:hypothetical protein